ncbi:MAG: hypothetical protein H7249_17100 [Chitinophagaceae bacterium]|nr:hypothetical protein [Oligoflexus sp.]
MIHNSIEIKAWMNFPKFMGNKVLDNILRRSNRNFGKAFAADSGAIYWDAKSLGLDHVEAFRLASHDVQNHILRDCTQSLMREAFAIERAGMAFAAKMVLLSDDLESRILYSQFGFQEASHYQAIAAYIPAEPRGLDEDPFLALLKDAIERGGRMSLTLIIQVLLEGWGLLHYKKLAKDCLSAELAEEFRLIVQDEAHHHGSGIALLDLSAMDTEERSLALQTIRSLLGMVAVGPWSIASILCKHLAPDDDPRRFYPELRHDEDTSLKLQQLKRLLLAGGAQSLVEILDNENMFLLERV